MKDRAFYRTRLLPSPAVSTLSRRDDGATLRAIARAIELQQQGRLDDAEAAYARLLAEDDEDPTVLVNAGMLALARGEVSTALARLERAIGFAPSNAIAHNSRGLALVRLGRREEAQRAFQQALALLPAYPEAERNLREITNPAGDV